MEILWLTLHLNLNKVWYKIILCRRAYQQHDTQLCALYNYQAIAHLAVLYRETAMCARHTKAQNTKSHNILPFDRFVKIYDYVDVFECGLMIIRWKSYVNRTVGLWSAHIISDISMYLNTFRIILKRTARFIYISAIFYIL